MHVLSSKIIALNNLNKNGPHLFDTEIDVFTDRNMNKIYNLHKLRNINQWNYIYIYHGLI